MATERILIIRMIDDLLSIDTGPMITSGKIKQRKKGQARYILYESLTIHYSLLIKVFFTLHEENASSDESHSQSVAKHLEKARP